MAWFWQACHHARMPDATVSRRGRRLLLVFMPLASPLAIIAAVGVFAIVAPPEPSRLSGPGSRGSLVWGNGIFANRGELRAWLTLHGGDYRRWERHHPGAIRLIPAKHGATSPRVPDSSHSEDVAVDRISRKKAHRASWSLPGRTVARAGVSAAEHSVFSPSSDVAAATRSRRSFASLIPWLLIAAGVVLAAGALAPKSLFRLLPIAGERQDSEVRASLAVVGIAVWVGVFLATQLN